MSENLPILYQHVMFGLPNELACKAFLWAVERPGEDRMCYRAEAFAREVATLAETVRTLIDMAEFSAFKKRPPRPLQTQEQKDDILRFILTRHANWRFGGNLNPRYLVTA